MHFMDADVRTILHVTSLKHISQYAGQPKGVFFSMMLNGQLQSFEFETSGVSSGGEHRLGQERKVQENA